MCSVSTNIETKYLPDGTCETVADFIFPVNTLWIFALTHLSFGSLILLFSKETSILPFVKLVEYDFFLLRLLLNFG